MEEKKPFHGHHETQLSEGRARRMRVCKTYLDVESCVKLDHEVTRRKSAGEDRDATGQRFDMNRSYLIRELIHAAQFPDWRKGQK